VSCLICESNRGVARISPGPPIYEGEHWIVEHAYPSALLGWLVIVLKRHAEALHLLTEAESVELGMLQWASAKTLASLTGCAKEYIAFFAEMPGFHHVHFHVVPRHPDLDPELRGGKVFAFLHAGRSDTVPADRVAEFCARAATELTTFLATDVSSDSRSEFPPAAT
jgi:diadenosine tetraphosphate (Ap4A) HIT family hydrolase